MKYLRIVLSLALITLLTSCSNQKDIRMVRLMQDEMKSVSADKYSMFISKHKDAMSAEILQQFQDIYYLKPTSSDKSMQEVVCVAADSKGIALFKTRGEGENRYRLMVIEYSEKITNIKVYALYEV